MSRRPVSAEEKRRRRAQGSRIRSVLRKKKLFHIDVAKKIGMSAPRFSRMLAGTVVRADVIPKLAHILGVRQAWLEHGEE